MTSTNYRIIFHKKTNLNKIKKLAVVVRGIGGGGCRKNPIDSLGNVYTYAKLKLEN
jgi:hypothetical protein